MTRLHEWQEAGLDLRDGVVSPTWVVPGPTVYEPMTAVRPMLASLRPSLISPRFPIVVRANVNFVRARPTQVKARREAMTWGGALSAEGCLLLGPGLAPLAPHMEYGCAGKKLTSELSTLSLALAVTGD